VCVCVCVCVCVYVYVCVCAVLVVVGMYVSVCCLSTSGSRVLTVSAFDLVCPHPCSPARALSVGEYMTDVGGA
jgi:hypothetical protein